MEQASMCIYTHTQKMMDWFVLKFKGYVALGLTFYV